MTTGAKSRLKVDMFASNCGCVPEPEIDDGDVVQRVERIHLVLRGLHGDEVVHAVGRVDPVVARRLAAGRERDQQRIRHVVGGQTHLDRLMTVHIHVELRRVDELVHVHVHRARDLAILPASSWAS